MKVSASVCLTLHEVCAKAWQQIRLLLLQVTKHISTCFCDLKKEQSFPVACSALRCFLYCISLSVSQYTGRQLLSVSQHTRRQLQGNSRRWQCTLDHSHRGLGDLTSSCRPGTTVAPSGCIRSRVKTCWRSSNC